jgi:hypothetical protein
MGGQVILSMPGSPCRTCLGFLNEATLAREAALYGDAGLIGELEELPAAAIQAAREVEGCAPLP